MRSVLKSMLAAFVVMLTLGALAATSASAHEFIVEGKSLSGEEAFTGTNESTTTKLLFHISGLEIAVRCEGSSSKGHFLAGGILHSELELQGCVMTSPASCKLPVSEEKELDLDPNGQLIGFGTESPAMEFKGEGSSEFLFVLEMEGASCVLPGGYQVRGKWICTISERTGEKLEHLETCKVINSKLLIGGEPGTIQYEQKLRLMSNKKWSVS